MGILPRRASKLDPQSAYALWAESYPPFPHNPLMAAEQAEMERLLREIAASRALDLGTGTGRYLHLLAASGVATAVGLDRSWAMLSRARSAGAPLVRSDASALPFARESFDLIVSSLMAGDVPDLAPFAREARRVLVPGGSLLYSDFHPCWREKGWKRTFRTADGRTWRIPLHPHGLEDHRAVLEAAKFELVRVRETRAGEVPEPVCLVLLARASC